MSASIEGGALEYAGAWYRLSVRNGNRRDSIVITPEALDRAHKTDGISWKDRPISESVKAKLLQMYEERAAGIDPDAPPMELRLTAAEIQDAFES